MEHNHLKINPFSVGRWVSGEHFYGRLDLIDSLLRGNETCHWVIGKRRMGKTSLLRQVEWVVNSQHPDKFALFWDIQGSYDSQGFFDSLYDAIEDNQDLYPQRWEGLDFDLEEDGNVTQLLKKLARATGRANLRFYLLIDESEELLNIAKQDGAQLSKLRRFFQTNHNVTTIMVSSPSLEQLTKLSGETSPFLHGFIVSYLGNFTREETLELLARGVADGIAREYIYSLTYGNPFETQLLARHYYEDPDLDQALLELETNPSLNQTLEVNYRLLEEDEQTVLKEVHCGMLSFQDYERAIMVKLTRMGYLRQAEGGGQTISSAFQSKWLALHLLDGQNTSRPTHPGELIDGIVINPSEPSGILKQILEVYKLFMELAQQGKRVSRIGNRLDLPLVSGSYVMDVKSLPLVHETRQASSWSVAVEETVALLDQLLTHEVSWSVSRLHQMLESNQDRYSEKDYLDLMMLIAEEAELD